MRRRRHACVLALVATAFLSACSPSTPRIHLTHAPTLLNRGNNADVSSLDPDEIVGNWEANVVGDCIVGLTTEGPDGAPIPGAAERWEVSADKKTWTFHLRHHLWSDGVPVTAQDFVFAWRRILDPRRSAQYASYLYLVKNARAVNAGTLPPTALGIFATDDRTLVVQLEDPAPFLPEWLTHQTTYPVPRHVVLIKGGMGKAWKLRRQRSLYSGRMGAERSHHADQKSTLLRCQNRAHRKGHLLSDHRHAGRDEADAGW